MCIHTWVVCACLRVVCACIYMHVCVRVCISACVISNSLIDHLKKHVVCSHVHFKTNTYFYLFKSQGLKQLHQLLVNGLLLKQKQKWKSARNVFSKAQQNLCDTYFFTWNSAYCWRFYFDINSVNKYSCCLMHLMWVMNQKKLNNIANLSKLCLWKCQYDHCIKPFGAGWGWWQTMQS